ncbi:MAG: hypothetical protein V4467_03915 [Patescibacteria group bacterium]
MIKNAFFSLVDLFYSIWLFALGVIALLVTLFVGFRMFSQVDLRPFYPVLHAAYVYAPLWSPILFGVLFFKYWMRYIRADFVKASGSILLEIKIPKETLKSPLAMEIFFTSLYQTGSATFSELYWKGKVRPWFSLELASIEGQVKFFIWSHKKFRNLIEAQLYAQYPAIEIHEAEDYMAWAYPDHINLPMWATYFKFTKESIYPIKTYVDYGLDKDPKEEFKIDPMTSVLEYLGSLRKGEQTWIQIIIQAHRKQNLRNDALLFTKPDWKHHVKHEIEKIRKESITKTKGSEFPGMPNPTKGQQNTIAALERSVSKYAFEACIRGIYISKKESFNPINITGLIGSFRQYSSNDDVNGFKLGWFTDFDFPWQDFRRIRRTRAEHEMLEAIKLRSFFQPPFKHFEQSPIILNTEELATIFHFPGSVAGTPGFVRLASKRVEPPGNLPI